MIEWIPNGNGKGCGYNFILSSHVHVGLTFSLLITDGNGKRQFQKSGFRTREGARKRAEKWLKAVSNK